MHLEIKKTWLELIQLLVLRDLRVRYRGSILGYLWSMMNPLLYMAILTAVFSRIVRFEMPHYHLYILSGILGWNLFQQGTVMGANSIASNGSLLRKVNVPAAIFPAASVASVAVNFALALIPFLIISVFSHQLKFSGLIFLPFVLVLLILFVYGNALWLSAISVRFKDVGHMLEPVLMIGFYGSPVIYPLSAVPENYRFIMALNPMSHFLDGLRSTLYTGTTPSAEAWLGMVLAALVSVLLGTTVYNLRRNRFVYDL